MKKAKAITLLSIVSAIVAFFILFTFLPFSFGVKNFNSALGAIELDYDLAGGRAYTLKLSEDNVNNVEDIDEVLSKLNYRMESLGYTSFEINAVKDADVNVMDYDIVIKAKADTNEYGKPNVEQLDADIVAVSAYGKVRFFGNTSSNPDDSMEILKGKAVIKDAEYVGPYYAEEQTIYQVAITFYEDACEELLALYPEDSSSYYLKITVGDIVLLDGSSPLNKEYIVNNQLGITTTTEAGARQAALQLSDGGLDYLYTVDVDESYAVSSIYGENAKTIFYIVIGAIFFLIMISYVVLFKKLGVVACLSSIPFLLLEIIMLIAIPGIRLSLGGLVGVLMAIILNTVCTYTALSGIKNQAKLGKTAKNAVAYGLRGAFVPTTVATASSAVLSLVLLIFTKGLIKNFAITLGIGAVLAFIALNVFFRMYNALILPLVKDKNTYIVNTEAK